MIKSIRLQNFQSHEDTTLELDPGINIVIGQSDSGKSALLRGLRWVVENVPGTDGIRRWGSKRTRVDVELDNGIVARGKDGKNWYHVSLPDGKADWRLEAVGKAVPDEVQEALGFHSLNFQWQHDRPFLLSETSGEVARVLNRITRLDVIDTALSNIASTRTAVKGKIVATDEELERQQAALKEFENLDALSADVAGLQKLEAERVLCFNERGSLLTVVNQLKAVEVALKALPSDGALEHAAKRIARLEQLETRIRAADAEAVSLRRLTERLKSLATSLERTPDYPSIRERLQTLEGKVHSWKAASTAREALDQLLTTYEKTHVLINQASKALLASKALWKTEAPDVCPLCGEGRLNESA